MTPSDSCSASFESRVNAPHRPRPLATKWHKCLEAGCGAMFTSAARLDEHRDLKHPAEGEMVRAVAWPLAVILLAPIVVGLIAAAVS